MTAAGSHTMTRLSSLCPGAGGCRSRGVGGGPPGGGGGWVPDDDMSRRWVGGGPAGGGGGWVLSCPGAAGGCCCSSRSRWVGGGPGGGGGWVPAAAIRAAPGGGGGGCQYPVVVSTQCWAPAAGGGQGLPKTAYKAAWPSYCSSWLNDDDPPVVVLCCGGGGRRCFSNISSLDGSRISQQAPVK